MKIGVRKAKDGGEAAGQEECIEILEQARRHQASGEPFSVVLRVRAGLFSTCVVPFDLFCQSLKQQRLVRPGVRFKMAFESPEFQVRR